MSQEYRYINKSNDFYPQNGSEIRLKNLEKENSDLLERNKNLEQRLKQLEQYISTNVQASNANIYNINLNNSTSSNNNSNINNDINNNNPMSTKNKRTKTPLSLKIKNSSNRVNKPKQLNTSSSKTKIRPVKAKNKNNNNISNISSTSNVYKNKSNINNSQYLSTKKSNKSFNRLNQSKSKLPSTILKDEQGIEITNQRERDEYNIKILNEMIMDKKKEIESLEYELKLQQIARSGEGYLDYELNLWQKKTNTLSTVFYQQFNNIKSEAYLDKNEFQNLIHNMKKICEKNQSYEENICEEILNKQMWFINSLDNKNKDIQKRLEKMKNIFK